MESAQDLSKKLAGDLKSNSLLFDPTFSGEDLRAFSRTVAEIEWLTLILVLLYQVIFSPQAEAAGNLALGSLVFSGFVLAFHYFKLDRTHSQWKIAIETWAMIAFITWVLSQTGRLDSPLVNLYLLVVIMTALTLGKVATLLQILLIAACYVWLGAALGDTPPALFAARLAGQLAPLLIAAYVTTMLSSDIRSALTHIRMLSGTDELTGVANMRAFTGIADRISRQAERYNNIYSVLMVDSDSLKKVNDLYGHEAGNRLLKMLVSCIQSQLRETDALARYGGDEFIVLLPETTAAGAEEIATRIRERVEVTVLSTRKQPVRTTVSIGIAAYPGHGSDFKTVVEHADKALYASKSAGRNRVTVSTVKALGKPGDASLTKPVRAGVRSA